ncbi:MAG: rod shape-determining protein MreC [Hyphomicrobiales bacterium]
MLRNLFSRRTDWTVFVVACLVSFALMLLAPSAQVRTAWFLQHKLLAPVDWVVGLWDRGVATYWENERLRAHLARLRIESDQARADHLENERLRDLLGLKERHPYELIAARVVGRSLDRLGGSLTLDKGDRDGIRKDLAVLTPEGLVGRVERTHGHAARVLTLLNRDCAVAVRVQRSRVDGVLRWEYGDRPILNLLYVSSQEDVKPGDLIVTSGLGGIFPEGIRVGRVDRVGLEDTGLMKEIVVTPAVDFRSIEEVLVYAPTALETVVPSDLFPPEPADTTSTAPADSVKAASVVPDSAAAGGAR